MALKKQASAKKPAKTQAEKRKGRSAASASSNAPAEPTRDVAASSSAPQDDSDKRGAKRRLGRRGTDDAVDRVIQEKLMGKFSEEAIVGTTNKKGQTPREYIAEAIRDNRGGKKHLSTGFWTAFFQEFALQRRDCDGLPDPDPAESVRDEVVEKLTCCHDPNPATRSVEPMISFLKHCGKLNYVEVFGIIRGCQESPAIVRSQYWKVMMAVLDYISRPLPPPPPH